MVVYADFLAKQRPEVSGSNSLLPRLADGAVTSACQGGNFATTFCPWTRRSLTLFFHTFSSYIGRFNPTDDSFCGLDHEPIVTATALNHGYEHLALR